MFCTKCGTILHNDPTKNQVGFYHCPKCNSYFRFDTNKRTIIEIKQSFGRTKDVTPKNNVQPVITRPATPYNYAPANKPQVAPVYSLQPQNSKQKKFSPIKVYFFLPLEFWVSKV